MVTLPVNTQTKPVEYLVRKFAINHGLPRLAKLIDPSAKFPVLTGASANALAAVALLKLRVAEKGKAQAAGTEWDAEVTAAQTFADAALAAVSASQAGAGFFPTPTRIAADLDRYAARKGLDNWEAPGDYDTDAFTHANSAPVAAALTPSVDTSTAIDINLLSDATDAEDDTVTVLRVGGKNFAEDGTFTVTDSNGKDVEFTMTADGHITAPAQTSATTIGPFVAVLYDGRTETNRNVTITVTNSEIVAADLTPSVETGTAIDIDLLSGATDGDAGDTIIVLDVEGTNWDEGGTVTVTDSNDLDVVFTMAADYHLTAAAQAAAATIGPFTVSMTDGIDPVSRDVTVTITAA